MDCQENDCIRLPRRRGGKKKKKVKQKGSKNKGSGETARETDQH